MEYCSCWLWKNNIYIYLNNIFNRTRYIKLLNFYQYIRIFYYLRDIVITSYQNKNDNTILQQLFVFLM